ncbi:DUF4153 domain-containing protein [Nonomuraea fuscirosea]|uniref:DUF4153 domain-containing protein n=1 Tax=Nonomuraea fuscirosea TaxID=1291556 RepID=UPI0034329AC2
MNPLDFLGRIKVKLGIVIVLAVGTAFVVNELGIQSGLTRETRIAVAVVLALIMVQVLAMGMTKPLRQMASAAQTIAKGSYTLRVNATSRDEVGELARAFNAMAADLGEVDRQRRELVANVSHELRTPITGLRAVLENVVDGVSAPDPVTMRTALAQTERLGRLVAQLLDLSRLDSGTRLIEAEAVELAPLIEQAVREASLAREDVVIRSSVPAGLVVRADPDLLAQVLANLLDNAVRHSPPAGEVVIRAAASGAEVRLEVADQGPGIPASARARVFERFSRLDAGRAADSGGAGLGLAIVKEIVELHGGSIRIDDGAGCRMVVELPGRTTMAEAPLEGARDTGDVERSLPAGAAEPAEEALPAPAGQPVDAVHASGPPASPVMAAGASSDGVPAEKAPMATATAGPAAAAVVRTEVPGGGGPVGAGPAGGHAWPIAPGGGGMPPVGMPVYPPPREPFAGGLGRMVVGGVLGLLVGLVGGMFAAVLASVVVGDGAALVTLIGCTALMGALGASLGAGSGRRAMEAYQAATRAGLHAGTPEGSQAGAPGGEPYRGQMGPPPAYVPPPLFPRPEVPDPPRWLLPAAVGAGVFAAVALPEAQVGLGIVLVAMVVGGAALPALLHRMTPWTLAFGLTAYWLISMAAVRDADWLVAILLVAGAGLGALAVSGAGAGWVGVIRGGMSVLLAFGPVPWFLAGPLRRLTARRRVLPMVGALSITAVLLLVFGLLFASADAIFASYVERLTTTPEWAESIPGRIFLFLLFAVLLVAVVLVALRPVVDPVGPGTRFRVSRSIWALPLTAVNMLFASFVAVQITALFGGDTLVLRTAGLTYAEYARQGFFQLVVVSVFVLGIVAVAAGLLRVERAERWLLAALLGVLCGLTMVVLASALHRMNLYTDAYGLSRLRLSVEATVWWLGALFALVLLAGAARLTGRRSGWLPRTIVLVTGLGLVAFSMVNPDLRVAESQVQVRGVTKLDSDYLGDLGAEAVPALDRLPEPQRSCVLADVIAANRLDRPDPWNGWNLARSRARDLLAERPVVKGVGCTPAYLQRSD